MIENLLAITLLCNGIAILITTYSMSRSKTKSALTLTLLIPWMIFLGAVFMSQREGRQLDRHNSAFMDLNDVSNGVYQVIATCRNSDARWLAIIQPTHGLSIDKERRTVSVNMSTNENLLLVVIPDGQVPISSPQHIGLAPFTGFALVGTDNTNRFIRDYNPFTEK